MSNPRPIKNRSNGEVYSSIKECREKTDLPLRVIRGCIDGKFDYSEEGIDLVEIPRQEREAGRMIVILETGDVFQSVTHCAEYLECNPKDIYLCLSVQSNRRGVKGYTFDYV